MDEATIEVCDARRVRVLTGLGLLGRLGEILEGYNPYKVLLVMDSRLPAGTASLISSSLGGRFRLSVYRVEGGEQVKGIGFVESLWRFMAGEGFTRRSMVVVAGGGTLLDAAGFAAATFMRGVPTVYIPTTTLAQVDASIGGKTGIDFDGGKNIVGVFHHPEVTVIDPELLLGLPRNIYLEGFSEVVKHAVIAGRGWLEWLERHAEGIAARDPQVLYEAVAFSVSTKLDIVSRDYVERGVRAVLNYGHTYGHAVEASTGYRVPHGHAVSLGLVAESMLAMEVTGFPEDDADRIHRVLEALSLPTRMRLDPERLVRAMKNDKKFLDGTPRIPLPRRPGDFTIEEIPWRAVEDWVRRASSIG